MRLGGARAGDKTLVDVLVPFVDAFPADGGSVADAWRAALPSAARRGRGDRQRMPAARAVPRPMATTASAPSTPARTRWPSRSAMATAPTPLEREAIDEPKPDSSSRSAPTASAAALKDLLADELRRDPRVRDGARPGVHVSDDPTAYPSVGIAVAEAVARGEATGRCWSVARGSAWPSAPTRCGIRAAVAHDPYSLERSVLSNDCQVLCMGANVVAPALARSLIARWLDYRFDPASASAAKVAIIALRVDGAGRRPPGLRTHRAAELEGPVLGSAR